MNFLTTPILNLLIATYKIFEALGIPGALGLSIITMTTLIRLALWPLTSSQLKSTQKMAALKPHLDRIKAEHGHDKVRHQQEVNKLYKEHNINPLAGCLPLLLQIPVFYALFNVLNGKGNGLVNHLGQENFLSMVNDRLYTPMLHLANTPSTKFLGFNLADKPSDWKQVGILILLIPLLTGVFQFAQSKMITAPTPKTAVVKKSDGEKKKEDTEDTMAQVSSQMTFLMPAMIAFFSYGFPLGLSLYWNTFTIIGIIQQYMIAGAGALNQYLPEKWRK